MDLEYSILRSSDLYLNAIEAFELLHIIFEQEISLKESNKDPRFMTAIARKRVSFKGAELDRYKASKAFRNRLKILDLESDAALARRKSFAETIVPGKSNPRRSVREKIKKGGYLGLFSGSDKNPFTRLDKPYLTPSMALSETDEVEFTESNSAMADIDGSEMIPDSLGESEWLNKLNSTEPGINENQEAIPIINVEDASTRSAQPSTSGPAILTTEHADGSEDAPVSPTVEAIAPVIVENVFEPTLEDNLHKVSQTLLNANKNKDPATNSTTDTYTFVTPASSVPTFSSESKINEETEKLPNTPSSMLKILNELREMYDPFKPIDYDHANQVAAKVQDTNAVCQSQRLANYSRTIGARPNH
jgi:hypothetical protein